MHHYQRTSGRRERDFAAQTAIWLAGRQLPAAVAARHYDYFSAATRGDIVGIDQTVQVESGRVIG